jgi:hypothetical protein
VAFRFVLCVIGVDDFKFPEEVKEVNGDGTACAGGVGEDVEELGVLGKPKLGGAEIVTKSGAIRATIKVR